MKLYSSNKIFVFCYFLINILIFCFGYISILESFRRSQEGAPNIILISIGTSLLASGIVMLLEAMREYLKESLFSKIKKIIYEGGLEALFKKRDLDRYDILMEKLSKKLDITGYTLNSFFDSYSDLLSNKAVNFPNLNIRILLVDPQSPFSEVRALIENRSKESFADSVDRIKTFVEKYKCIEMRLLSAPLSTMIFRIDDNMFVGPQFHKKTSKSTLTIELNKKGWLFEEYEDEFNRLWEDAKEV